MRQAWQETPLAVRIVGILSLCWFAFLLLLLEGSKTCDGADVLDWWQLQARYLACRPANEVGDFLSGAFAPVAFAWLVATVFIQSAELKEQRRELALGREVAEQQRDAMKAQAVESERQVQFLSTQILMQQREERDKEAEALLSSFIDEIMEGDIRFLSVRSGDTEALEYDLAGLVVSGDVHASVRRMSRYFADRDVGLDRPGAEPIKSPRVSDWVRMLDRLYQDQDRLTPAAQGRVHQLNLQHVIHALSHWAE